jgi:hypothetical protein
MSVEYITDYAWEHTRTRGHILSSCIQPEILGGYESLSPRVPKVEQGANAEIQHQYAMQSVLFLLENKR